MSSGEGSTRGRPSTRSISATPSPGSTRTIERCSRCATWPVSTRSSSHLRRGGALPALGRAWRDSSIDSKGSSAMHELSAFESRLAAGLEDVAGPRRGVDAIAIARVAASRAPARQSVWSRFSPMIGDGTSVRGRRLGGLGFGRRPLVVVVVIALITALAFGAIAVGSGMVRLTSVLPSQALPSVLPPSQALPIATPVPTSGQPRPAAWTSAGTVPTLLGHSPFAVRLHDGRVLVMSAVSCGGCKIAAYVYDPATGSWSADYTVLVPVGGSATLLDDGTVLVAGSGKSGTGAQLYDPGNGGWIPTGNMTIAHWRPASSSGDAAGYTATLLRDGNVL